MFENWPIDVEVSWSSFARCYEFTFITPLGNVYCERWLGVSVSKKYVPTEDRKDYIVDDMLKCGLTVSQLDNKPEVLTEGELLSAHKQAMLELTQTTGNKKKLLSIVEANVLVSSIENQLNYLKVRKYKKRIAKP